MLPTLIYTSGTTPYRTTMFIKAKRQKEKNPRKHFSFWNGNGRCWGILLVLVEELPMAPVGPLRQCSVSAGSFYSIFLSIYVGAAWASLCVQYSIVSSTFRLFSHFSLQLVPVSGSSYQQRFWRQSFLSPLFRLVHLFCA